LSKFLDDTENLFKDVMLSFYKISIELSDEVSRKKDEYVKIVKEYINKTSSTKFTKIAININAMLSYINDIARIVRYLH